MSNSAAPPISLARRVAGQGALLLSAFAASQLMSFARNAMLGHMLSKGDFGIAAILTLLLQLLDSLTDLGVDRLIVQAPDGNRPRFIASQHLALIIRGLLIGLVLLLSCGTIADFFSAPDATWSVAAIALVPVIKGFQHLDARRAQRHLQNRPFVLVEVAPQAVALLLTWPVVTYVQGFGAVVWLALAQAVTTLLVSHAVAERPYRVIFDATILRRLIDFGWPIWLSAFPLIAVYHGDRIVIGRLIGIEDLAGYSAAFMVAMVPGLVAAKVGQSLMLPMFATARDDAARLAHRFAAMTEATAFVAAVYLATAMLLGGFILQVAFGPNYAGLGGVMAWLAAMWSMRMLQAVPGMALLAAGQTKPFLVAGFIRASALVPAALCAGAGWGLEAVAASGFAGELASLAYISRRMDQEAAGLSGLFARRALFLVPAATTAGLAVALSHPGADLPASALALLATLAAIAVTAIVSLPEMRSRFRTLSQT